MIFRNLLTFPARHLALVIPVVLFSGLATGLFLDTSALKTCILPVTILMIYPAMIGFQPGDLFSLKEKKLMLCNLGLNFVVLPIWALLIGRTLLAGQPDLFAGLLIISVIPGGNMVVSFTMMFKGNVPASLKMAATNLILGSFLAPVYLYALAGTTVSVDVAHLVRTISLVIFVPLVMGISTYRWLMRYYSEEEFRQHIRPLLPGLSSWGLVYILFTSISMKAPMILGCPTLLIQGLGGLLLFYFGVLVFTVFLARSLFDRRDGITLFLNGVLRNLAISIGLAVTAFGSRTAMMVALAFLFQQQIAVWFWKLDSRWSFLARKQGEKYDGPVGG
ncbi:arsenic resistance protein [Desulfolithobacter sp.]